ncbi:MAG: hypothetical protein ACO3YZ_07195, partial [Candidatus Nanopelagicaceae bacterium]
PTPLGGVFLSKQLLYSRLQSLLYSRSLTTPQEVVQLTTEYESMTMFSIFDSVSDSQLHLPPQVSGTAALADLPTIWVGFF